MNARSHTFILLFLVQLALQLGAANAQANDSIVYRLKWLRNVSAAGALYAEETGLFNKAGLQVEVKEGGPERDAIRELELGHADFGEASADQVLRARAKGSPVVVIAQLFQVNPLQWMYRPDELKITGLADLKQKVIGVTFGGNDETIMRTLLAAGGLSEQDVRLFSVRYDYTPFYRRQVQLWPVYRNAQGPIIAAQLQKANEQTAFFNPADFGVNFVANSVITTEQILKKKPELAKAFLTALLAGWQQALDPANQESVLLLLQKYDPNTSPAVLKEQLAITKSLIAPQKDSLIGAIDTAAWKQTQQIMYSQKLLTAPLTLEQVLYPLADTTH